MPCYRRGQPAILHMGLQINLGRRFLGGFENAFMEICQADSVEYLGLYDKYFIGWLRKYKPPAGRKTRLRAWQLLMLMAHEVRLWRQKCFCVTFDKSNKTYSASDFACRLVFGWNMIRCGQIFM